MSTSELSARVAALATTKETPTMTTRKTLGRRIVESDTFGAFKAADYGTRMSFKSETAEAEPTEETGTEYILGRTESGVQPWATLQLPGIIDHSEDAETTILDLVTTGTTANSWLEYRVLDAYNRAAAVVPEKGTKPRGSVELSKGEAAAYEIATGIDLTNQEIRDDATLVRLIDGLLRLDLREKLADLVLNGSGSGEPRGILNTPGLQSASAKEDILTTLRAAKDLFRRHKAPGSVSVLLSVEDAYKLDTTKTANEGYLYSGAPFGQGSVPTAWGMPIVVSSELPGGTALVGKFGAFDLLVREGVTVEAFPQHADYAERNLVYVRAECSAMTVQRWPSAIAKVTLPA